MIEIKQAYWYKGKAYSTIEGAFAEALNSQIGNGHIEFEDEQLRQILNCAPALMQTLQQYIDVRGEKIK